MIDEQNREDQGFQPQQLNDKPALMKKTAEDDLLSQQGDNLSEDGDMGREPDQGPNALGEDTLDDLENDINQ